MKQRILNRRKTEITEKQCSGSFSVSSVFLLFRRRKKRVLPIDDTDGHR
jgi:hypothetical protein